MMDPFVFLAPVLLLAVVGLLGFVGCDIVFGLEGRKTGPIDWLQVAVDRVELAPVAAVTAPIAKAFREGSLIVVWIWYQTSSGQTVTGVSDDVENEYEEAAPPIAGKDALARARQHVWYVKSAKAGGANFTVTFSGTVEPGIGVGVIEYTNADADPRVRTTQQTGFGSEARSPDVDLDGVRMLFGAAVFAGAGTNEPGAQPRLSQEGNVAVDYLNKDNLPDRILCPTVPMGNERDWIAQLVAFK